MVTDRTSAVVRSGLRQPAALAVGALSAALALSACSPLAPAAGSTSGTTSGGVTGTGSSPEVQTLNASADTYINTTAPTTAYGTKNFAFGSNTVNRGFVRFATPVAPAGTRLTAAKLRVWTNSVNTAAAGVTLHP